ncbi:MAG TPA: HNH endonuclease signature motif containing protein, partial [Thermoanaerobaculia bacterium]
LVAAEADETNVLELIARAKDTTWEQTDRETTAREDRKNRALGIRRLWAPTDVMTTIAAAILSAQRWSASRGHPIDAGEALAVIADHFLKAWPKESGKPRSSAREEVLRRSRGRCSVPGCTLPARHVHHIRYRSHGGTNDPWNEIAICIPHHLRGIHDGHLSVQGRAGERLLWRFGNGEIFVTLGDDDVRRVDPDRVAEPAPPAYRAA